MKNTLKIDFAKEQIIMDRTFAQNVTDTRSTEYAHLQQVRRDYPDFKVVLRKIKKNPNKETYKGLTYKYMRDYILTHEDDEKALEVLAEFSEMRQISRCHSQAKRYPVIKNWFLEKYPEIKNFGELPVVTTQEDEEEYAEAV